MSQLELIFPNGDIRFLNVEIEKGVVNIGRHPENDIVIDAPGVLDFHAVLDCRRRPYQLINFGDNAVTLNGDPVARNMPQEAQPFDQIGLAGYTLLWLDEGKTAPSPMPGAGRTRPPRRRRGRDRRQRRGSRHGPGRRGIDIRPSPNRGRGKRHTRNAASADDR